MIAGACGGRGELVGVPFSAPNVSFGIRMSPIVRCEAAAASGADGEIAATCDNTGLGNSGFGGIAGVPARGGAAGRGAERAARKSPSIIASRDVDVEVVAARREAALS